MERVPHWSTDPYWLSSLDAYINLRDNGNGKLELDLKELDKTLYLGDEAAYRLMKAMVSVYEQEGQDGFRGAPRLAMALLARFGQVAGDPASRALCRTTPDPNSYWIIEPKFLAGEYPVDGVPKPRLSGETRHLRRLATSPHPATAQPRKYPAMAKPIAPASAQRKRVSGVSHARWTL